jgi:long-chain acyl-CoA synthetase
MNWEKMEMLDRPDATLEIFQAEMPLGDTLDATVARFGHRPAMEFLGRRWNYAELGDLVARATRGLQDLGVKKDVKIGLCLPNTPYSIVFYYAALKTGATVVNYNPMYVERELLHQIKDSSTTIMVVLDLEVVYRKVANVAEAAGLKTLIVCPMAGVLPMIKASLFRVFRRRDRARIARDARHTTFASVTRSRLRPAQVKIDSHTDIAVLQYTGGTTGVPKGAMLTHANLTANCRQIVAHWDGVAMGQEATLAVLPLSHVFAMTSVMNYAVATGAEIILLPRFDLLQVIDTIERMKPTIFNAVPTIYTAINDEATKRTLDLSSIRLSISGGAPLPNEVRTTFTTLTGCLLVEGYGLTEAGPVVACNPPSGLVKGGSVGLPLLGTVVEIRDLEHPEIVLPTGENGEVSVRGPQVMAGYWEQSEATEAAFVDGALLTGDIGMLDADGYLFLVDRIKDVIFCGGYNVYPRLIEDALYQHPAVREAVVVGLPDAYRGEVPKAFVTLNPDMQATGEQLRLFLADYISKIEMPRSVEIRDSLPKTTIGKLSKNDLIVEEAALASSALARAGVTRGDARG